MLSSEHEVQAIIEEVTAEHLLFGGTNEQAAELRHYREGRDAAVLAVINRQEMAEVLDDINDRIRMIQNAETRRFFFLLFLSEHPAIRQALEESLAQERRSNVHNRIRGR